VRSVIRDHLGGLPDERIRVSYGRVSGEEWWRSGGRRWWRERMHTMGGHMEDGGAMMRPFPRMGQMPRAWHSGQLMEVSLQMADKSWLNFAMPAAAVPSYWSSPYLLSLVLATAMVLVISAWAVRRATAPLALFAQAAERLGTDVGAPALAEKGPREVRRAAAAFNEMQRRLGRFIRDRTQMLAAVSHDLRTPITRLRLRAEFVEDAEQRDKMLADLKQMESMIAATLAFARDDDAEEPRTPFDLGVLLQDLCDDAVEAGHAATYEGASHITYGGRPMALKRAFANLIDNAVKYGGMARVALATDDDGLTVVIDDDGRGISEDELEKVFAPFYRVDPSRSRESGGTGLGLAVVRSVVRGHGGEVVLANCAEGGLRATVTLPVA
jgi:signal transduction histidine kinase